MVGLARIAVSEVYDSETGEAVFFEHMMHYDVVFMRVYSYDVSLPERPVEKASCCVVARFCDCYPMYYIHIPSSGEPFTLEERMKSYKMAYDFYTRETGSKYLVCDCGSWLLLPEYQNVFPEGGSAKDFYRDFDILFSYEEDEFGDAWRVFGNIYDKKFEDYPEDTRMRRAFKKHLIDGGKNGYGVGILVFDGEKLLTRKD